MFLRPSQAARAVFYQQVYIRRSDSYEARRIPLRRVRIICLLRFSWLSDPLIVILQGQGGGYQSRVHAWLRRVELLWSQ
jgi:hypothetical protein